MNSSTFRERSTSTLGGGLALSLALGCLGGAGYLAAMMRGPVPQVPNVLAIAGLLILGVLLLAGLFVINPNEARVLQLFGKYVGTSREEGLRWTIPFYTKTRMSLRVRSFETAKIKVNDVEGNPIEIATIVVWRVRDTAEACFAIDDYVAFVHSQAESALRNLATHHPYDAHDESVLSLRGHTDAIAEALKVEIQTRVAGAGVTILESRIAHLAYAPEIAQAMLQRQQAGAIIAARQRIVEGAVGMVQMALTMLADKGVVHLDEERKAAMVSNLLVVLCGERGTQPVVNTGTLYQ